MILKNYLKRVMPSLFSVVFVLVWFAIAPLVRAVVPAPDGGYPGFNTAEGAKRSVQPHHRHREHCSRLVFALERHRRELQHRCRCGNAPFQRRKSKVRVRSPKHRQLARQRF